MNKCICFCFCFDYFFFILMELDNCIYSVFSNYSISYNYIFNFLIFSIFHKNTVSRSETLMRSIFRIIVNIYRLPYPRSDDIVMLLFFFRYNLPFLLVFWVYERTIKVSFIRPAFSIRICHFRHRVFLVSFSRENTVYIPVMTNNSIIVSPSYIKGGDFRFLPIYSCSSCKNRFSSFEENFCLPIMNLYHILNKTLRFEPITGCHMRCHGILMKFFKNTIHIKIRLIIL